MSIRFYENFEKKQVIAVTNLKDGSTVKARATCAPGELYNYEYGKRLAEARLKERLAQRDFKESIKAYNDACTAYTKALRRVQKLKQVISHNEHYLIERQIDTAEMLKEIS